MKKIHLMRTAIFAAAILLSGCADYGSPSYQSQPSARSGTGIVDRIEVVRKGDVGRATMFWMGMMQLRGA